MIPKHKTELDEQSYTLGERAQLLKMFRHFLHEFALSAQLAPSDDPVLDLATRLARAEVELREVRAKLRRLCREHGDNSWDDELCLPDVIEKHLVNPLLDRASTPQPVDASNASVVPRRRLLLLSGAARVTSATMRGACMRRRTARV